MAEYKLKSNKEIIDQISVFGFGVTEFHTADIERLIKNNEVMKKCLLILADASNTHEGHFGANELELVERTAKECLASLNL